ncbi:probable N-acetyltransferase HLS1-like isoform X1 [Nicotiana tomentosiformis]|uniref:Probable N-acetyltransferase HLS1-like n=2 Tax=Nicotiana TaxID=4085 RepID=A0A1S4AV03_TOBAC|nr:probable N-acetyltransferase HLS1-like isoform X1 [Nicotiana tomentosiformis]XP_016480333.1 PREDICTED: probable N-acetyltransferase HLS1-like [Nicotiana tabacum]
MIVAVGDKVRIIVREFDGKKDCREVEEVERSCEVGPTGKLSLFTDLLGDPICRVRHSPAFLMLVAETEGKEEKRGIVGMIRGCIKTVTCGKRLSRNNLPVFTKIAYILGLRVSPLHRRKGIGLKLVRKMEEWFRENGAEYSYIATENDNHASVKLFTHKCGYTKFRTPSILVQPVFAHRVKISTSVTIIKLSPIEAETLYRHKFSTTEFFPTDIDSILTNKLNLGTFLAVPKGNFSGWNGVNEFLTSRPESWAVLSVWNCKDVFKLEVRGASKITRGLAKTSRLMDRAFPWLKVPSVPEVFRPFGLHFLYGLGGEGPLAVKLVKALCDFAHNLAGESRCGVVVTEIASCEPLKLGIPHWKKLSCAEDLWCIKRLGEDYSDGSVGDWTKSKPGLSIFVDPREF